MGVPMKSSPPPKVKRSTVLGEDQRILSLMFENITTKIEGLDHRVMLLHDSTKDGLRDIGERLTRVETMQTNLESSVKTMDSRIQRVESESVRTADLHAVNNRIVNLEIDVKSHGQLLHGLPTIKTDLNTLAVSTSPARTFFDRVRWLWFAVSGIIGSVVTAYVMRHLFGQPSF